MNCIIGWGEHTVYGGSPDSGEITFEILLCHSSSLQEDSGNSEDVTEIYSLTFSILIGEADSEVIWPDESPSALSNDILGISENSSGFSTTFNELELIWWHSHELDWLRERDSCLPTFSHTSLVASNDHDIKSIIYIWHKIPCHICKFYRTETKRSDTHLTPHIPHDVGVIKSFIPA